MRKIVFYILLSYTSVAAQDVSFTLVDCGQKEAVPFAHIINLSQEVFTITDKAGNCTIRYKPNDTLIASHLGYNTDTLFQPQDTLCLTSIAYALEEVKINTDNKQKEIGNFKHKRNPFWTVFGLSYFTRYALLIYNTEKTNYILDEIQIPVKYLEDYDSGGDILVQFVLPDPNNKPSDSLIAQTTIPIKRKGGKRKQLLKHKVSNILLPKGNFFIVLSRIKLGAEFDLNSTSYAVNPFIRMTNNKEIENIAYYQYPESEKWLDPYKDLGIPADSYSFFNISLIVR